MKLATFQTDVAAALIDFKRPVGRPSAGSATLPVAPSIIQRVPVTDVRNDGTDHLPVGEQGDDASSKAA